MAAKKIRVGIWGLGRAGLDMHCPELNVHSDKFEIVAGCDVLQERIREALAAAATDAVRDTVGVSASMDFI